MVSRCLVIDDEVLAREGLEKFIKQTPFLEHAGSFGAATRALGFLRSEKVDLLFLDIQMPEMNGIELMKALIHPPQVIFTTAYREFALDGFELNAVDYLLKPFSYDRFLKAVHKIKMDEDAPSKQEHIFIKCDGMIVKISLEDILYVETAKDYVFIYTTEKRYMTLVSMRQIENNLPKSDFMRIHRSYLIGLRHVEKIEGNRVHIANTKISISRALRDEVYERIIGDRLIERL